MLTMSLLILGMLQTIPGRNGKDLYRVEKPEEWSCNIEKDLQRRQDTRNALAEFTIPHQTGNVTLKIHNFPSYSIDDRVPPQAQVARWRKEPHTVAPQSFSGFCGLLYQDPQTLAWTLQLGNEHYHTLCSPEFPQEMRSDVTIKAVGPTAAIAERRSQIIAFARSFELIEEIP